MAWPCVVFVMKLYIKKIVCLLMVAIMVVSLSQKPICVSADTGKIDDFYKQIPEPEFDASVWDVTDYYKIPNRYCKSMITAEHTVTGTIIGLVYLFPISFKSHGKIDGREVQCMFYRLNVQPQTAWTNAAEYKGLTQYVKVRMSNVQDENEMHGKMIVPSMSLADTVADRTYSVSTDKSKSANIGYGKDGWTIGAGGAHSTNVTSSVNYRSGCLNVESNVYNEAGKFASWYFNYNLKKTTRGNDLAYCSSDTWQVGAISWARKKDANYFFTNFQFTIEASFGLMKNTGSDKKPINKLFTGVQCGLHTKFSDPYEVYNSYTEFAK